jgi:hypothetical protein
MSYKTLGGVLAVLASVAAIGSLIFDIFSRQEQKPTTDQSVVQSSIGANGINIVNGNGSVSVIQAGKSKLDMPSFDYSLQPFPGWRRNPELGVEFNRIMATYLDKTVYLSITLSEDMTEEARQKPDEYGRVYFTVRDNIDDSGQGGSEYLIHLSEKDSSPFEFKNDVAVLSGYFKVYDINGPRQGFMSVNLRPVKVD